MSGNSDSPGKARARGVSETPLSAQEEAYLEKLVSLYLAHLRGTRGRAESTIKNYRGVVVRAVCEIGRPPWAWVAQDIDDLLSAHALRGVVSGTQLVTITGLRGLQNWLLEDIGLCNEIQQLFGFRPQRFITSKNSIPYATQGRNSSDVITPLKPEQCARLLDEFQFQIEVARKRRSKSYKTLRRDYATAGVRLP